LDRSVWLGYHDNEYYSEPGDLVVANAAVVQHPGVIQGILHKEYQMTGVVTSYVYPDENFRLRDERCLVEWMPIKVSLGDNLSATLDDIELIPISPSMLNILGKRSENKVIGYNAVMAKGIKGNFENIDSDVGWVKKT